MIDENKCNYSLVALYGLFGIYQSVFYRHSNCVNPSEKNILELIKECQSKNRQTYGYRRIKIWIQIAWLSHGLSLRQRELFINTYIFIIANDCNWKVGKLRLKCLFCLLGPLTIGILFYCFTFGCSTPLFLWDTIFGIQIFIPFNTTLKQHWGRITFLVCLQKMFSKSINYMLLCN